MKVLLLLVVAVICCVTSYPVYNLHLYEDFKADLRDIIDFYEAPKTQLFLSQLFEYLGGFSHIAKEWVDDFVTNAEKVVNEKASTKYIVVQLDELNFYLRVMGVFMDHAETPVRKLKSQFAHIALQGPSDLIIGKRDFEDEIEQDIDDLDSANGITVLKMILKGFTDPFNKLYVDAFCENTFVNMKTHFKDWIEEFIDSARNVVSGTENPKHLIQQIDNLIETIDETRPNIDYYTNKVNALKEKLQII